MSVARDNELSVEDCACPECWGDLVAVPDDEDEWVCAACGEHFKLVYIEHKELS